jgi:carbamoyltransferase
MDKLDRIVRVFDDGSIRLNMDYFSFHHSLTETFNAKFVDVFGTPRRPESPFFTLTTNPELSSRDGEAQANQYYADVAASVQRLTEEVLLKAVRHLHRVTGLKNLVMAGGVALNSVANGRIMRESPFEEVYIQPNAGDAGGALGAALYVWHVALGHPRRFIMEHAYYGEGYTDAQIRHALEDAGLRYEHLDTDSVVVDRMVDALRRGQVVGFSQGRFEWGPRALGNRSILADPRRSDMKEIVNTKIKFREQFRPFAPVVPEDDASRYFDMQKANGQYPPRFMLMVAPARSSSAESIPAVVHMGTGRLQTVRKEWNPLYYDVVRGFGEATGVPVLLNTSFNLRGEPLVATPANAINTFMASGIDLLVLERFLVRK